LSSEVVGFASSDMELLMSTLLFLSREAARLVALRAPLQLLASGSRAEKQQLTNLAWLPVPLGLLGAGAVALAGLWRSASASASASSAQLLPGEAASFLIFCLSAALESLAEPAFILSQALLLFGPRTAVDTCATLLRCVATYALAVLCQWPGTLAYAGGQLCFSGTLLLGYWAVLLRSRRRSRSCRRVPLRARAASACAGCASAPLPSWAPLRHSCSLTSCCRGC
jgi:hypothetical protein